MSPNRPTSTGGAALAVLPLLWLVVLCSSAAADAILTGAGATFPLPLYRRWIDIYHRESGRRIAYQGVGSGGGIRRLLDREVDFGATDAFLSDEELRRGNDSVLHIPTCVGAVVLIYNLPGAPVLRFTPGLVADIFLGRITTWSDKRIRRVNPDVALPQSDIAVVHRSESSGTSFIFTSYLTEVSAEWKRWVGPGKSVRWPAGMGVEGNPGVAGLVSKIQGSIGYAELTYAHEHNLPTAALENRSGNFITPTLESVSAAADIDPAEGIRVFLTNTSAVKGYPISAFTYLIVHEQQDYGKRTPARARRLAQWLWWTIHEGQQHARSLHYAPLPRKVISKAEKVLRRMNYNGTKLID